MLKLWTVARCITNKIACNLRPRTTRKYVYLVTRGHIRSRDKDGGHTIRSVIAENRMLHANFTAGLYKQSYYRSKFYIAGIGIFDLFAPVISLSTRWFSSHAGTVVPLSECCKDDNETQWKSIKDWEIWPPLSPKPLNRLSLNLAWVMKSGTLPLRKILLRSDKGFCSLPHPFPRAEARTKWLG